MHFMLTFSQRPASPKNPRQAPPAPKPAPPAPGGYGQQQQQYGQQYAQPAPQQQQNAPFGISSQNGQPTMSMNLNPSNLISAFNTATSLSNTYNNIKSKFDTNPNPPARPAPVPSNANLPNPLIPQ